MIFFISRKRYLIGEVLKCIFFWNPGIAKVFAAEGDIISQNKNFTKVDRRVGGINREGAFVWINTVFEIACGFSSVSFSGQACTKNC